MIYDKEVLSKILSERLNQITLYQSSHWIGVHIGESNSIHISYAPTWRRIETINKTRFDIEVRGDTCYILSFNIESGERRIGHGRKLSCLIEGFCIDELSCSEFITTPSGESANKDETGKCFWEKQGYSYFSGIEVKKTIYPNARLKSIISAEFT